MGDEQAIGLRMGYISSADERAEETRLGFNQDSCAWASLPPETGRTSPLTKVASSI
jgi:hypothetical protein